MENLTSYILIIKRLEKFKLIGEYIFFGDEFWKDQFWMDGKHLKFSFSR